MKMIASAAAVLLSAVAILLAAGPEQTYTRPAVPPVEALDRLNLKLGWRAFLPTEGRRDGLFNVRVLEDQILVLTRSGVVTAVDLLTGAIQWRTRVGNPYELSLPLASNDKLVVAISGTRLFLLQRRTGEVIGHYAMPDAPAAPAVADDEHLYVPLGTGLIQAYFLPRPGAPAAPGQAAGGSDLKFLWEYKPETRIEVPPLVSGGLLLVAGTDGSFRVLSKYDRREFFEIQADATVAAPMAEHGDIAYVASRNFNLYAFDILNSRLLWRFVGGGPIARTPVVTDEDVFLTPERVGLYRLLRRTGEPLWQNSGADRFLAENLKFVYATDHSNRLLILDRARGTKLATYDGTRDFVVPVVNERTDRLILASHDGLMVCLHDRDYPVPLRVKTAVAPKKPASTADGKPAGEMGEAKPPEM